MKKDKILKREEATKRQQKYDKLTTAQKIEKLDRTGHEAKKQRQRLEKETKKIEERKDEQQRPIL